MRFKNIYFNKIHIKFHRTALHLAVLKGNIDIIKLLVTDRRIDVNVEDEIENQYKSSLISISMIFKLIIFEENQSILQTT